MYEIAEHFCWQISLRAGRPYGKTIVFTTPVHFCNTPILFYRFYR